MGAHSHTRVQQPQRYFGKFTRCMTLGAHKLVPSGPFLDYRCELRQLLPALYSDVRKKTYIGAHLRSGCKVLRVDFLIEISAIYTKLCAQTFPPIFGLFAIFDRIFAKILAPPSKQNTNSLMLLKGLSLLKKH